MRDRITSVRNARCAALCCEWESSEPSPRRAFSRRRWSSRKSAQPPRRPSAARSPETCWPALISARRSGQRVRRNRSEAGRNDGPSPTDTGLHQCAGCSGRYPTADRVGLAAHASLDTHRGADLRECYFAGLDASRASVIADHGTLGSTSETGLDGCAPLLTRCGLYRPWNTVCAGPLSVGCLAPGGADRPAAGAR